MYDRWPKKREFIIYYMLYKKYKDACNIGDAINDLVKELGFTKRTSMNILKRLKAMGFIDIEAEQGEVRVIINPLEKVLDAYLENYVRKRKH